MSILKLRKPALCDFCCGDIPENTECVLWRFIDSKVFLHRHCVKNLCDRLISDAGSLGHKQAPLEPSDDDPDSAFYERT